MIIWGLICKTEESPEGEWLVNNDGQVLLFAYNDAKYVASLLSVSDGDCIVKEYEGDLPLVIYEGDLLAR